MADVRDDDEDVPALVDTSKGPTSTPEPASNGVQNSDHRLKVPITIVTGAEHWIGSWESLLTA